MYNTFALYDKNSTMSALRGRCNGRRKNRDKKTAIQYTAHLSDTYHLRNAITYVSKLINRCYKRIHEIRTILLC